jgi:hypothetical protein
VWDKIGIQKEEDDDEDEEGGGYIGAGGVNP